MLRLMAGPHLSHQVKVVGHHHKSIQEYPSSLNQKPQAFEKNVFVRTGLQELFPLQAGGGNKLRVFSNES
jgi:hypothetical protein